MTTVVFVYIAYFAINLYHSPSFDDLTSVVDTQAHLLPVSLESEAFPPYSLNADLGFQDDFIPPLYDLPHGLINRATFESP